MGINKIKMRRQDVEASILHTWLQDGPKIIIMENIIFIII